MNYNTNRDKRARRILLILLAAVIIGGAAYMIGTRAISEAAEDQLIRCWVMCKPGSQVNVRRTPSKNAMEVGYLDAGDSFLTDGDSKNGFIRCYGIGEYGEGWIYLGYVVTEEPKPVFERYVCVSNARVACRRWMGGPKVGTSPWIVNGSNVDVFYLADGWACTSRGYIMSEWLEVDPK